jgi:hypothetical protein
MKRRFLGGVLLLFFAYSMPFVSAAEDLSALAATACPPGTVKITDQTRPIAREAGVPDTSACWDPNSPYVGTAAGNAKVYLRSQLCAPDSDNYGGLGPDGTIEKLDAKFAQCAAAFLKTLNQSGTPYCIREGARSVEKQQSYVNRGLVACKAGAQCEHPRGIAIDINPVGLAAANCDNYKRAHQLAPSFGLSFYLGCSDPVHFVPEQNGCYAGSVTGAPTQELPSSIYDFPQQAPTSNQGTNQLLTAMLLQQTLSQATQFAQQSTLPPYIPPPTLPSYPIVIPPPTTSSVTNTPDTGSVSSNTPSLTSLLTNLNTTPAPTTTLSAPPTVNLNDLVPLMPTSSAPTTSLVPPVSNTNLSFISSDLQNSFVSVPTVSDRSRLNGILAQLAQGLQLLSAKLAQMRPAAMTGQWLPIPQIGG